MHISTRRPRARSVLHGGISADLWPIIWCSRRKPKLKQQLITALRQQDRHHLESLQRDATVAKGCLRRVTVSAACPNPCFCAPHIYLIQFAYIAKGLYWYAKLVSTGELPGRVFQSNEWCHCFLLAGKNAGKNQTKPQTFQTWFSKCCKEKANLGFFFFFHQCRFPNL